LGFDADGARNLWTLDFAGAVFRPFVLDEVGFADVMTAPIDS